MLPGSDVLIRMHFVVCGYRSGVFFLWRLDRCSRHEDSFVLTFLFHWLIAYKISAGSFKTVPHSGIYVASNMFLWVMVGIGSI